MKAVLWLYLKCVATFGVYTGIWAYRAARRHAGVDRGLAIAWGFGFFALPIGSAVLLAIARGERRRLGEAPRAVDWIGPGLHFLVCALWLLPIVQTLWAPYWLLLPLSACAVHAQLRHAPHGSNADAPSMGVRVAKGLAVMAGVGFVAFATHTIEGNRIALLGAQQGSASVMWPEGGYRFDMPLSGWSRVSPGINGDEDAELEMLSHDELSFVVTYAHSNQLSLDSLVDQRRDVIAFAVTDMEVSEKRFFHDPKSAFASSFARYQVGSNFATRGAYRVLTRRTRDKTIEVIGYTSGDESKVAELEDIVTSLHVMEASP